jgi:preprotein translocase subunit SecE
MAVEVVPQQNFAQKTVAFYHDVMAELKRVTWPDMPQVRQLSVGVVLLSLFIGGVIALMDVVLQQLLVRLPSAF